MAYITDHGLKNTFQRFLDKLKEWLPFKMIKSDNGDIISFPSKELYKNTFEIHADGKIYILGTNNQPEHLQESLDKKGTTIVYSVNDLYVFLTDKNVGRFLYIVNGNDEYPAGLYIVGIDAGNGGTPTLIRIGTTVGAEELETRVVILEQWKQNGMIDKENIMDIIDPENN